MKKLAIDIVLRLTFSKWIRQAFPVSIAFIYCYVSGMPSVGRLITKNLIRMNTLRQEFCDETNTPMGLDNEFDYIRWLEAKIQALRIHDVSGSLPLADLEKRLDEALDKETPETLNKWLEEKMFADESKQSCNQKCKFGNLVVGHAVYCHSENPDAPRKCRRSWYTGGKVKDEDCEFYEPNPIFDMENKTSIKHEKGNDANRFLAVVLISLAWMGSSQKTSYGNEKIILK